MTPPEHLLNPATRACLFPCSLNVCPGPQERPSCPCHHQHQMVSHPSRMRTLHDPALRRWCFSATTRLSLPLKTHRPTHPAPTAPPASFSRLYPNRSTSTATTAVLHLSGA